MTGVMGINVSWSRQVDEAAGVRDGCEPAGLLSQAAVLFVQGQMRYKLALFTGCTCTKRCPLLFHVASSPGHLTPPITFSLQALPASCCSGKSGAR